MTDIKTEERLIPRYVRSVDQGSGSVEFSTKYDIVWTDRLSGKEVLRYDGADPANTNPAYGARSDFEVLADRGIDLKEEITLERSILPVPPGEPAFHARAKKRQHEKEQELLEARDLFIFLGDFDCEDFKFEDYLKGEADILRPALECRGFKQISFYSAEEDSFGPLVRGCRAFNIKEQKWQRFLYG